MHNYKNLKIWIDSARFAVEIYKLTNSFPKEEIYGLTSQLRRAGVSISSNIAEGSKRTTNKDFRAFLAIAHGSGAEIESQLFIAKELGYIMEKKYKETLLQLDGIMKMVASFSKSLSG